MESGVIEWAERNQLELIKQETIPGTENNQCKDFKCDELEVFKEPRESQGSPRRMRREAMQWEIGSKRKIGARSCRALYKEKELGFNL